MYDPSSPEYGDAAWTTSISDITSHPQCLTSRVLRTSFVYEVEEEEKLYFGVTINVD